MTAENRLIAAPKRPKPKSAIRYAWPAFRGGMHLGKVIVLEERSSCLEVTPYDAITATGEQLGGFETRAEAAMAIGARAVSR